MKKLIGTLIMPLSLIISLLLLSIFLYKKRPEFSLKLLVGATALLIITTTPYFSDLLMKPVEDNFPAFTPDKVKAGSTVNFIVILGCRHTSDSSLPATSQLAPCSLQRMVEALRISMLYPQAKIITSGASFSNKESNAEKVKQALISLGVDQNKIITVNTPKDTEEESIAIAPIVTDKQVVLVTNADHIPRAVKYFNKQGVHTIAAPASAMVKNYHGEKGWAYYFPSTGKLRQTTMAWYETVGLFVQWLKR